MRHHDHHSIVINTATKPDRRRPLPQPPYHNSNAVQALIAIFTPEDSANERPTCVSSLIRLVHRAAAASLNDFSVEFNKDLA